MKLKHEISSMEIGIDSFASAMLKNGVRTISNADAIEQLLERIEFADRLGHDVFGIDEHLCARENWDYR